jgi:hypothetical protein
VVVEALEALEVVLLTITVDLVYNFQQHLEILHLV